MARAHHLISEFMPGVVWRVFGALCATFCGISIRLEELHMLNITCTLYPHNLGILCSVTVFFLCFLVFFLFFLSSSTPLGRPLSTQNNDDMSQHIFFVMFTRLFLHATIRAESLRSKLWYLVFLPQSDSTCAEQIVNSTITCQYDQHPWLKLRNEVPCTI